MSNKQNKLRNLQNQIDELKKLQQPKKEEPKQESSLAVQQHGKLPGLGQQFDEVGKTMGQLKDLIPKKKHNPNQPQQNYIDDPFVVKMKKWLLVGLTVLVGGGAAIMVVVKIIGRVFG